MKHILQNSLGVVVTFLVTFLGGVDNLITALFTFMVVDYITGLVVAIVFHNSPKTETGTATSNDAVKGIVKKIMILVLVGVAHTLDNVIGVDYIRNGVCFAFITTESISLLENAGLMGIKIPKIFVNSLEVLKKKFGMADEAESEVQK